MKKPREAAPGIPVLLFLLAFLLPREAHMSGSAVGTITREYFALSGDDGLRIHFTGPEEETKYHSRARAKIAARLEPLAERVAALIEKLRKKPAWSRSIRPYRPGPDLGTEAHLAHFELAEYASWLRELQAKGSYLYTTSFGHQPADGRHLTVTIRLVLAGRVEASALYELEDGLHTLRAGLPDDPRYAANPDGVSMRADGCEPHADRLESLRKALAARLEKQGLFYTGHAQDGSLFIARLEGPEFCLAQFELTLAGQHHWGRTRRAFVESAKELLAGAREWPGFPPDPAADEAPWRIVVDPPVL
ncbi:MAG: hypothetical protein JXR96_19215 [Deltaproteobacteria bacterium]|nr:hypothetical protein [Deltaproteobacteria bacterium]